MNIYNLLWKFCRVLNFFSVFLLLVIQLLYNIFNWKSKSRYLKYSIEIFFNPLPWPIRPILIFTLCRLIINYKYNKLRWVVGLKAQLKMANLQLSHLKPFEGIPGNSWSVKVPMVRFTSASTQSLIRSSQWRSLNLTRRQSNKL